MTDFIFKQMVDKDIFYILNCFFMFSFLGWIFESIVMSIEERSLVNRGFIRGPLCTVYGAGALTAYYMLQHFSDNYFALFCIGAMLATIVEVITAKAMTVLLGDFWWDYTEKPFNYKGVICLESTLCWGALTVAMFIFIHPAVDSIVGIYYPFIGRKIAIIVMLMYGVDFATSFRKAYNAKLNSKEDERFAVDTYDFETIE